MYANTSLADDKMKKHTHSHAYSNRRAITQRCALVFIPRFFQEHFMLMIDCHVSCRRDCVSVVLYNNYRLKVSPLIGTLHNGWQLKPFYLRDVSSRCEPSPITAG